MQVLSDVLLGHVNFPDHCASTKASTSQIAKQVVPLYSSNDDLLYNTEHPLPRYTQGAFMQTFEHLFKLYSGIELEVNRYGKPHRVQFQYAEKVLIEKALKLGASSKEIGDNADDDTSKARPVQFDKIYMIGDNPRSDVRGARIAGQPWESILLGTGIHRAAPGVNDSNDPADHVVHGVLDAINLIVEKNRSY
jgi:ribonucleotide monophosphatase NagD (HAD superfamily)